MKQGDYVLATKYDDGDPQDHWVVGFYDHTDGDRHFVVDGDGKQFRANGFRRVENIDREMGTWLLSNVCNIEHSGKSLWTFVAERRGVKVSDRDPVPFNLNHEIKFKMRERGMAIYEDSYRKWGVTPVALRPDADGWYTMQLWDFAHVFGPHLDMGFDPPVETEILIVPPAY